MRQVLQHQKTGDITTEDIPAPECPENGILVANAYSLISAGTERSSVEKAQSSLLQRAKKQPDQVKMVMDYVKKEGVRSTYKRVKSKLESYKELGYSSAGIVVETNCDEFAVGDKVACAGAGFAVHSEYVAIPKNLACKVPEGASLSDAAYTTMGAIATQGFRQANPRLGENVAVIGLGLLGQITIQLLKAAGCRVVGFDLDESLFDRAKFYGCERCLPSSFDSVKSAVAFSDGLGCDSVIITASTPANQPMELALEIARKKGKVVVVGDVSMHLPRSPFYQKELDVTISCSYGPGRYDPNYEVKGEDYPPAYVRWTENRNMRSFLNLIAEGKMDVGSMTSHTFEVDDAKKAYDLITGKINEKYLGVLLKYPEKDETADLQRTVQVAKEYKKTSRIGIAFVGAGTFAQTYLIPPLKGTGADLVAVSTATPANAQSAATKFGFAYSSTDSTEIINKNEANFVFCATQHDSHAKFVLEAVRAGKPVFVEKPLAVNEEELQEIERSVEERDGRVMVGFNRRFSKPFKEMKDFFGERSAPMSILYRVNAGFIPKDHWSQQAEQGGRIIGEACHFIDCMVYLTGALPTKVYAESLSAANLSAKNRDNVSITVKFTDGSVGTLLYLANGDKALPKEYCEVFCEGASAVMNDFRTVELYKNANRKQKKFDGGKGHREEVESCVKAVQKGEPFPISFEEIKAITEATFAAEESLDKNEPIII